MRCAYCGGDYTKIGKSKYCSDECKRKQQYLQKKECLRRKRCGEKNRCTSCNKEIGTNFRLKYCNDCRGAIEKAWHKAYYLSTRKSRHCALCNDIIKGSRKYHVKCVVNAIKDIKINGGKIPGRYYCWCNEQGLSVRDICNDTEMTRQILSYAEEHGV